MMKHGNRTVVAVITMAGMLLVPGLSGHCSDRPAPKGEAAFLQNCSACHAAGGNEVNPEKTFSRADLRRNNILTPADIVRLMRNPGPGMLKFDAATIPDEDARAIAEYILSTFNK